MVSAVAWASTQPLGEGDAGYWPRVSATKILGQGKQDGCILGTLISLW